MDDRLKRLSMRSWRRGMKEMDLILGPWSDLHLAGLSEAEIADYERLLEENDQDLFAVVLGQQDAPAAIAPMMTRISAFARERFAKNS